jgi:hypothetical protein
MSTRVILAALQQDRKVDGRWGGERTTSQWALGDESEALIADVAEYEPDKNACHLVPCPWPRVRSLPPACNQAVCL